MNPGEYIGKDGRKYRWKHERLSDNSAEGYDHQAHVHEWETEWIDPADWLDAKAALDALIEAESGEWVYLMARETQIRYRIHPDGSQPQWYDDEQWTEDIDDADWAEHYRKGREVALEQVRELVEAVLSTALHFSMVTVRFDEDAPVECHLLESHDWQRIRDAAWKVKL